MYMVLYSADTIQKEVSILCHTLINSYSIIILKNWVKGIKHNICSNILKAEFDRQETKQGSGCKKAFSFPNNTENLHLSKQHMTLLYSHKKDSSLGTENKILRNFYYKSLI